MSELIQKITNEVTESRDKIEDLLMSEFKNIHFYISPMGTISCWVNINGRDGTGITIKDINVGNFNLRDYNLLTEINKKIEAASKNWKEYFYCTGCGQVKPRTEHRDFVMAADYCKECAKKPEIAALIEESHQRGFYD